MVAIECVEYFTYTLAWRRHFLLDRTSILFYTRMLERSSRLYASLVIYHYRFIWNMKSDWYHWTKLFSLLFCPVFARTLFGSIIGSLLFSLKVFSVSKQFKIAKTVSFQKRPNASKIAKTLQNSEISLMVSITQPYQSGPLLWLWCMYQNQGRVAARH